MSTPDDNATGGTGDPNAAPPEDSQKKGFDYEAAYKGLQGTYQKMKETSDSTVASLTSQLADVQSKLAAAELDKSTSVKALSDLNAKVDALTQQLTTEKAELSKVSVQRQRAMVVMKEFPDLAPLEAIGGLPVPEGDFNEDGFRAVLQQYQQALGGLIDRQVKMKLSGETPPESTAGQKTQSKTPTADDLYDQLVSLAKQGKGGTEEYVKIQRLYDELTKPKE
jgi:chromosome segregation ATPase